jgi:streptogramin lyase
VAGNDGKLWYTSTSYLFTISTGGVVTQVPVMLNRAAVPCPLTVGPDGNAWLIESEMGKIARVTM